MCTESKKTQVEEKLPKDADYLHVSDSTRTDTHLCVNEQTVSKNGLTHNSMDANHCFEASDSSQNSVNAFDTCCDGKTVSTHGPQHISQKAAVAHGYFETLDSIHNVLNASSSCGNGLRILENGVKIDKSFDASAPENTENSTITSDICEIGKNVSERGMGSELRKTFDIVDCLEENANMKIVVSTTGACENGHMTSERLMKSRQYKEEIRVVECFEGPANPWKVTNASDGIRQIISEKSLEPEAQKTVETIGDGVNQAMIETSTGTLLHDTQHRETSDKTLCIASASNVWQTEAASNPGNQYSFVIDAGNNSEKQSLESDDNPENQLEKLGGNPDFQLLDDGQAKPWPECVQSCKQIVMDFHQNALMSTNTNSLINFPMQEAISSMHNIAHSVCEPLDSCYMQQLVNQEPCVTTLVSTDIEGWQRFDTEYSSTQMIYVDHLVLTNEQLGGGHPQQGQELWEQLLEDPLETNPNGIDFNVQIAPNFPLHEGNQLWLASPGNPFIENFDRTSNFSEADGFIIPTFQSSLMNAEEEPFQNPCGGMGFLSVSESYANADDKLCLQSMPEIPQHSLDAVASSSFMNVLDPASLAFKASTQILNGTNDVCGHETWEANFDTFMPVSGSSTIHNGTQEVPRSLSMPRIIGRMHGDRGPHHEQEEGHRWSFSVASDELETPSLASGEKRTTLHAALGFMSPRISPLVKKVVKSVQTSPVVGKRTLKNGAQSMSNRSSTSVIEKPKKSLWARCVCCSKTE